MNKPPLVLTEATLAVTLTEKAIDLLRLMAETGLWGISEEEVARRLIERGLCDALENNWIPPEDDE